MPNHTLIAPEPNLYISCSVSPFTTTTKKGVTSHKWRAIFTRRDANGKRQQKSVVLATEGHGRSRNGKPTKQMRQVAENEALRIFEQTNEEIMRSFEAHTGITVYDCIDAYIDDCTIQRSTISSYRGMLKNAIGPTIGNIALEELTKDDCKKWVNDINAKYSRAYAANSLRLLKGALKYACDVDQQWIDRSVAANVKLPKADLCEQEKPNALTEGEAQRLLTIVNEALLSPNGYRELPFMLAIKISLYTGLRRSEICALRWTDVDLDNGRVHVTQSIGYSDSKFYIKSPKSSSSYRWVDCPPQLVEDLARRKKAMEQWCEEASIKLTGDHYVIGFPDGSFLKPPRIDDHWRALSKNLMLRGTQNKPVPFHGLRHTYATLLIQNGVDITTVSSLMGHSKTSITLNRYASTGDQQKNAAAKRLGQVIDGINMVCSIY